MRRMRMGTRTRRTYSRNPSNQQNLDKLTSLKAPRSFHSICFGFVLFEENYLLDLAFGIKLYIVVIYRDFPLISIIRELYFRICY
jgi:hypothetical protein